MKKILEDKVALVTGGTSGIGRATAIALAKEGATVVICGRREKEGAETIRQVKKESVDGLFVKTDVSSEKEVANLINKIIKTYGRLDAAFNNAGVWGKGGLLPNMTDADYKLIFDTNVKGVFYAMKYEIPAMLKKGGSIINTSSIAGVVGIEEGSLYTASKHAVIGFTKSAALEYAKAKIRINAICPGAIDTPLLRNLYGSNYKKYFKDVAAEHPIGRIGQPEDVANLVVFLASSKSSFMTGQAYLIDGGFTAE
jgi:NAD(P)-dependent dehydrogenase (short-subunit alcohol dehydrogenase family)